MKLPATDAALPAPACALPSTPGGCRPHDGADA